MKFNNAEPWAADRELQVAIRDVVEDVRDRYDLILIDCPPNLHLCSWAALVASDYLIVPLQPEDYGAQGIIDVRESVDLVTELANPGLQLLGYLITMVNPRKSIHKMYEETLREQYGDLVFETRIPHAAEFPRPSRTASRSRCTSPRGPPPRRSRRSPTRSRPGWTGSGATGRSGGRLTWASSTS